jgi:hypothetical protein
MGRGGRGAGRPGAGVALEAMTSWDGLRAGAVSGAGPGRGVLLGGTAISKAIPPGPDASFAGLLPAPDCAWPSTGH